MITLRSANRRIVGGAMVCVTLPILLVMWLWFAPTGTGEFRRSPDGRFTAHASNIRTGTIVGGRDWYVEVRVVEAGRLSQRLGFHDTPEHASWPDMAACERSVPGRQRPGRRIEGRRKLAAEVAAWPAARNKAGGPDRVDVPGGRRPEGVSVP